jgi:hypothetical protein
VIQRFQIEDLVTQDISGVVFRALDTKTNRPVELRRFFPFGATADGLRENEQVTYTTMVEHLALINHPSLRAVIGGGCDPVDGMPFLATEWIEGATLQTALEHQAYPTEDATILLRRVLEVCELLSQALDEEAVWVETNLQDILIGAEGSGREVTFAFAPLKWLGQNHARRGMEDIATLCENLIIWNGKSVAGHAGQGLDGWLKWLRGAAATTTLREAREKLPAPVPAKTPSVPVARPAVVVRKRQRTSNLPFFLVATLTLAALGTGGWALIRYNHSKNADVTAEVMEDLEIPAAEEPHPEQAGISKSNRVYTPADHALLIAQNRQPATLEGVLEGIIHSKSGKTMYLSFSKKPSQNEPRGRIRLKGAAEDLSESSLTRLIGRKIRLRGAVDVEKIGNLERPLIDIKNRDAIQEVK